jgi:hypothetical protein
VWSDCPTPVGSDCLNMKTFVGESLQCRMVRVGVSQCLNGGWRNRQAPRPAREILLYCCVGFSSSINNNPKTRVATGRSCIPSV